jgi:hypothetical protein
MAKGAASWSLLREFCAGLETVAWYCASSSVNVGSVDVSNGSSAEKKGMLVNA